MTPHYTTRSGSNGVGRPKWLVHWRATSSARVRLVCFSYAGAGASAFRLWAQDLPPEVDICAVQLPGRESRLREAAIPCIDELLPILTDHLASALDADYALFGHSMGALLAFEAAHALRRSIGREPVHLFASGWRAPQLTDDLPAIANLPDDEFVIALQERYGGIPPAVASDPELLALFLPTLRSDLRLMEDYVHRARPALTCGMSVYGGASDSRVRSEELDAWRAQIAGPFRRRLFEGGHFFVQTARREVTADIADVLEAYLAAPNPL